MLYPQAFCNPLDTALTFLSEYRLALTNATAQPDIGVSGDAGLCCIELSVVV
jgi:hypothetical protein